MIKIKIVNHLNRFIDKCLNENINLYNIEYYKDYLICTIDKKDLKKIRQKNYYSKISIIKILGLKGILINIKKYSFDYILLVIILTALLFLSNIIFSIEIKHEDKLIKEEIKNILIKNGIKKFTTKKSVKDLNKISEKIIKDNKDTIEWISISSSGTKYIVAIEERIKKNIPPKKNKCHIVSTHNATITKIITSSGINLVEKNSKVNENDILISGEIILNDTIKDNVCASGEVYGEVWYKVNLTKPLKYQEKKYTKNNRYNFILNGNYFYKKNYKHYDENIVYKLNNLKIVKQQEYVIIDKEYTEKKAIELAISNARKKLLDKTGEKSKILSEKVLKQIKNNSKIELEIFFSVEQLISKQIEYKARENNDTKQSIRYTN